MEVFYFVLIIIGIFTYIVINHIRYKRKVVRFFSSNYVDWDDYTVDNERLEFIKTYWNHKKEFSKEIFYIDDITWNDLDMNLLYSKINATQSSSGEEVLYYKLRTLSFDEKELSYFNHLSNLFQNNQTQKLNTLISLFKLGKQNSTKIFSFLFTELEDKKTVVIPYHLLRLFLIISILSLLFFPMLGSILILSSISLNIFVHFSQKNIIDKDLSTLQYISSLVKSAKEISKLDFSSIPELSEKLNQLINTLHPLSKRLFLSTNSATNDLAIFISYSRIILLQDIIAYYKTFSFVKTHQNEILELYHLIGELDCAIALGEYRNTLPFSSTPHFTNSHQVIVEDLYHPLVENPIVNSLSWDENMIITGSNASGKSTFVKSLAISLIFSQTVGFSFSKQLSTKPSMVITSMAIKDDIKQQDSYFIAEIKSLKRLMSQLNPNIRCVCFIDEILKGTNTIERIAASASILEYLSSQNCLVSVASHDIELTEIMKSVYLNYHFRETITNDEILFDYKLYLGPTTTHNAILLLKHLGYEDTIVSQANHLANQYRTKKSWETIK